MIWLTQVNVRTRRQEEQAKEAGRLEPKGTQPVRRGNGAPAGIRVLPVYRTSLSHPLNRLKRGTWKPRIFSLKPLNDKNRMKKSSVIQIILSAAEFFFVTVFLVSCWQSDRALDKSGIGDPEKFTYWDRYAGLSIKYFVLLWVAAVILAIVFRRWKHYPTAKAYWRALLPDVLLPPFILVLGWVIILI